MNSILSDTFHIRPGKPGRPVDLLASKVVDKIKKYEAAGFDTMAIYLELKFKGLDINYHAVYNILKGNTYKTEETDDDPA